MRNVIGVVNVVFFTALGVGTALVAGGNWVLFGASLFWFGRVFLAVATSPAFAAVRTRSRIPAVTWLVAYFYAYAGAGVCVLIAALTQLEGAVAAASGVVAVAWIALWAWAARRVAGDASGGNAPSAL